MSRLQDAPRALERDALQRGPVREPREARVLVADGNVARLRLDEEEPHVLLDERLPSPEAVVRVVLEARKELLRRNGDARLFGHLALRGLNVRLARLDVAFGKTPVPAAVPEQQVLWARRRRKEDDGAG